MIEPCSNAMTECCYGLTLTKQEIVDFREGVVVGDYTIKEHELKYKGCVENFTSMKYCVMISGEVLLS